MPVIVNAIPKSGTNMLCRLLDLLGMHRDGSVDFTPRTASIYPHVVDYDDTGLIRCGDTEVSLAATRVGSITRSDFDDRLSRLCSMRPNAYIEAHMLYSSYAAFKLAQRQVKMIIIMRDPRAVALSHAEWFVDPTAYQSHRDIMIPLSLRERLQVEFFGLPGDLSANRPPLIPILARYRNMLPWHDYPHLYITTFERLVGEHGGGNLDDQTKEIEDICQFVGLANINSQDIQQSLWGKSGTFRKGIINRWAEYAREFPNDISHQIDEMNEILDFMSLRRR